MMFHPWLFLENFLLSLYYYVLGWLCQEGECKKVKWNDFNNKIHWTYSKEDYDRSSWTSFHFRY